MFLSLSSLETKHVAATKSLLFYPVAWPMDTYNMYMQLHFYMSTYTYVSFQLLYAHMQDVMWAVVIYLITLACVFVCVCVRESVCV